MAESFETEVLHAAIRLAVEEKIKNDGTYTAIGPVIVNDDRTVSCVLEIADLSRNRVDPRSS